MKKLLKTALLFLMTACIALSATGCINNDWPGVEEKLIDKGYKVSSYTETDVIEECLEECLINSEYTAVDPQDVNCFMIAQKGSKIIMIAFCKERSVAKKIAARAEELIIDFAALTGISKDEVDVGRDGKVAYIGHEDAVDDAK